MVLETGSQVLSSARVYKVIMRNTIGSQPGCTGIERYSRRPGMRLPRVHPVWKREGRTAPAECTVLGQSRSDPTSHHADIIVRTTFTGDPTRIVLRGSLVDLWDRLPSVCSEGIKQGALPWRRAGRSEFGRRPGPGEISYWNVSDRTPQSGGKLQLDNHQLLRHACLLSIYAAAHCLLSSR